MITFIEVRPVIGSPLELNTLVYPIHGFDPVSDYEDASAKKMQNPGEWPTFGYQGAMIIEITGDIVGAASTVAYGNARDAFMLACQAPITATGVQTTRRHGTLRYRQDNWSENADVDYRTISCTAPMTDDFVSVTDFRWSIKCFLPYFIGVGTSNKYVVG